MFVKLNSKISQWNSEFNRSLKILIINFCNEDCQRKSGNSYKLFIAIFAIAIKKNGTGWKFSGTLSEKKEHSCH